MARIGGIRRLIERPKDAPVRLSKKKFKHEGHVHEILYAGTPVPTKTKNSGNSRALISSLWRKKGKIYDADYSMKKEIGIIPMVMQTPPVVGTHGFITFIVNPRDPKQKCIYLRAIGVPEEYHGKEVAKKMLLRLERIAKARGIRRIELTCRENTRSHSFFIKNGFIFLSSNKRQLPATQHPTVKLYKEIK
jgi:GNAT superfamily N-acetyltransferase